MLARCANVFVYKSLSVYLADKIFREKAPGGRILELTRVYI